MAVVITLESSAVSGGNVTSIHTTQYANVAAAVAAITSGFLPIQADASGGTRMINASEIASIANANS